MAELLGWDLCGDLHEQAEIVLTHPNKWHHDQQKFLKTAAISAGLISAAGAETRLHFVEEAEAAACFALLANAPLKDRLQVPKSISVCLRLNSCLDAGSRVE